MARRWSRRLASSVAPESSSDSEDGDEPFAEDVSDAIGKAPESAESALVNQSVERVEECLVEIKEALAGLAQRPTSPPVDLDPLVDAVQSGFDRSADQATQTSNAVASLSEHLSQFGQTFKEGVDQSREVQQVQDLENPPVPVSTPASEDVVEDRSARQAVVMVAVALIVIGWSILFWITTGSPRLALGTLIGASFLACCLLLSRRSRK